MDADWKGEQLVRIPKRTKAEINSETNRIAQRLAHSRRRAAGVGQAQAGGLWARRIHAAAVHAQIKGGIDV
jgi:hypothetical protein